LGHSAPCPGLPALGRLRLAAAFIRLLRHCLWRGAAGRLPVERPCGARHDPRHRHDPPGRLVADAWPVRAPSGLAGGIRGELGPARIGANQGARMSTVTAKQYPVTHSEAEWKKILTPEQFYVMRGHGTEMPGSCALNFEKRPGTFECAGCGQQ